MNPAGLYATRFFLGVTEAGLFPGMASQTLTRGASADVDAGVQLYLSFWYRRREFGLRSAIFFSAATAAGAFGYVSFRTCFGQADLHFTGLLSTAIGQMDGVAGRGGWRFVLMLCDTS